MAPSQGVRRQNFENRARTQTPVLSKLIANPLRGEAYDSQGNRERQKPAMNLLRTISERTASVTQDLASMKQILPDVELAAQILVASVLSPKDMGIPELTYQVNDSFEYPELGAQLIEIIENFFSDQYEIDDELADILYDVLFNKGSYIRMVIPESSIDELINDQSRLTIESLNDHLIGGEQTLRPLGILAGNSTNLGQESADNRTLKNDLTRRSRRTTNTSSYEPLLTLSLETNEKNDSGDIAFHITDNPDILKMPALQSQLRRSKVEQSMRSRFVSFEDRAQKAASKSSDNSEQFSRTLGEGEFSGQNEESDKEQKGSESDEKTRKVPVSGLSHREIEKKLEKNRSQRKKEQLVELKTPAESDRSTYGHPLVINTSPEAVIPVHPPSDPNNHIGYFVLLDQNGQPIDASHLQDHYRNLQRSFRSNKEGKGESDIDKVIQDLQGDNSGIGGQENSGVKSLTQATEMFADVIERRLLDRLQNGEGFSDAEIERQEHVYQIMLSRALQRRSTQMLFVPKELVSYIAFYYTENGIGKSLLEETRVLASIRIVLMFADTMAAIKNATNRTELSIDLDPDDTDPMSTIDQVRDAFIRSRAEEFPIGEGDPSTVMSTLQRAGVEVVYSGHEGLPNMKVESTEHASNKVVSDRDLQENLRQQHIMALGLSPETVDISRPDFATSVVHESMLLNKRVALYQQKLEQQEGEFIRKYTYNSGELIDQLMEVIKKTLHTQDTDELQRVLNSFIGSINIKLPRPDTVTLENQIEAYENYERFLEDAINTYINEDMVLQDVQGEFADYLPQLQEAIKNYYLRRWLRSNNVLSELEEMFEKDEEGNNVFNFAEMQSEHTGPTYKFIEDWLSKMREQAYQRRQRMNEDEERLKERYEISDDSAGMGEEPSAGGDDFGASEPDDEGSSLFGDDDLPEL